MVTKKRNKSLNETKTVFLVFINAIVLKTAYTMNEWWYGMLLITLPLLAISIYDQATEKLPNKKKLGTGSFFNQPDSLAAKSGSVLANTITTTSAEALPNTGVKQA